MKRSTSFKKRSSWNRKIPKPKQLGVGFKDEKIATQKNTMFHNAINATEGIRRNSVFIICMRVQRKSKLLSRSGTVSRKLIL